MARNRAVVVDEEEEVAAAAPVKTRKAAKVIPIVAQKSTKNLPAVRKSTAVGAPIDWRAEVAAAAKASVKAAAQGGGGPRISVKNARLMVGDVAIKDNELDGLVVGALFEHAYHDTPYDADNPTAPVCFAHSEDDDEWAPHEKSAKAQSEECNGCGWDAFGSAAQGRGKACRNAVKLAILPMNQLTADAIENEEIHTMGVSVTNVKAWKKYSAFLAQKPDSAYFTWRTHISVEPDSKTQHKIFFETTDKGPLPEKLMGLVMQRRKEAMELLRQPYSYVEQEEKPAPARRGAKAPSRAPAAQPQRRGKY